MFVGHIKVLGGPYVARGPDVAQACSKCCTCRALEGKTPALCTSSICFRPSIIESWMFVPPSASSSRTNLRASSFNCLAPGYVTSKQLGKRKNNFNNILRCHYSLEGEEKKLSARVCVCVLAKNRDSECLLYRASVWKSEWVRKREIERLHITGVSNSNRCMDRTRRHVSMRCEMSEATIEIII